MDTFRTTEEWEQIIGEQVKRLRLLKNMDQRDVAEQAGVALNVIKNIEAGKGSTLKSFISVLKMLDRVEWLNALQPEISISPMQILKSRKKAPRQRASRRRKEVKDHV